MQQIIPYFKENLKCKYISMCHKEIFYVITYQEEFCAAFSIKYFSSNGLHNFEISLDLTDCIFGQLNGDI